MEELMKAYNLLMNITPVTNHMGEDSFISFYCMLLEEWCKAQCLCIEEVLDYIVEIVKDVNESEGRY